MDNLTLSKKISDRVFKKFPQNLKKKNTKQQCVFPETMILVLWIIYKAFHSNYFFGRKFFQYKFMVRYVNYPEKDVVSGKMPLCISVICVNWPFKKNKPYTGEWPVKGYSAHVNIAAMTFWPLKCFLLPELEQPAVLQTQTGPAPQWRGITH